MKIGYDEIVIEDFYDAFLATVKKSETIDKNQEACDKFLMEELCNNEGANYLITYIRWITACYMKMNDFLFEAFVDGDVAFFCQKEVEALDVEADQP